MARFAVLHGWHVRGVTASPLKGPKGNREFFLHLTTTGRTARRPGRADHPDAAEAEPRVKRIGIVAKTDRAEARTVVPQLLEWCAARGIQPVLEKETAALCPDGDGADGAASPSCRPRSISCSSSAATARCSRWRAWWATSACPSSASTWAASASSPR